jgi:transposase
VATDILGVSGRAMLTALVAGVRDPEVLAELAKGRLRTKIPLLREALVGRFGTPPRLMVSEMLARIEAADATIQRLCAEISRLVAPYAAVLELLETIPGVKGRTAEVILAETAGDMRQFPSADHLASWARRAKDMLASSESRRPPRSARSGLPSVRTPDVGRDAGDRQERTGHIHLP